MTLITRMERELIHEGLSGEIIGAAIDVLNELKPGPDEKLYERASVIELHRRGHVVDSQRSYPVFYQSELIGQLLPDLIVDNTVIVDPKVVTTFNETHFAQMIGYLAISKLDLALLLNFKRPVWSGSASSDKTKRTPIPLISMHSNSYPRHPCNPRF
jgi:GxxExxY protein